MSQKIRCSGGHFGRRDFLRVGSLPFLGIHLAQFLRLKQAVGATQSAGKAKANSCLLFWLDGGPSQMDTFDPKPNSSFKSIPTNVPGVHFSELLPKLSQRMDKLGVIRSMHTEENNHGNGTHFAATGHRLNPAMKFPSFASVISNELGSRSYMPRHIMVPEMPKGKVYTDYFRGHIISPENDPFFLPDPNPGAVGGRLPEGVEWQDYAVPDLQIPKGLSADRIENRRAMLDLVDRSFRQRVESASFEKMDSFIEQALGMISAQQVRQAFDMSQESDHMKDAYGRDGVGQSVLLARRLIEAGSRFVTAGGFAQQAWDTHEHNDEKHRDTLCPALDRTLSVLLDDLAARGLLDTTLVVVMGEFGRTKDLNVGSGRDHWPECWTAVLAGGGIQGGAVVGASDEMGAYVADRMVTMGDLFATIYKTMGIDWTKEYMHPVGRPVKIANSKDDTTGVPLHELL